jgi:molybdopterin/thiamine biosynthesis adenylyltransferase
MAVIRLPADVHRELHEHLFTRQGEHFAFLRARTAQTATGPLFLVHGVTLVPDDKVTIGDDGWEIDPDFLLAVVNDAIRQNDALIEAHNHGGSMPRSSGVDREQYADFVPYILDSLSGRPYAATVWSESTAYGEFFLPQGGKGTIRSITAVGDHLRQLVSRDDDHAQPDRRYDRQLPWFTPAGQQQLARLRFAIIGAGGTGSHVALQLPYLGARDLLVVDPDLIDDTSGNRTITATPADLDTPKAIAARRTIKAIAPTANVDALVADLRHPHALDALKGADVLIGCVDNDGARLVLNELAVAYAVPYFDLASGIDAENGSITQAGGRLAVALPGGPCLLCMDEIDRTEARYFLSTPEEQAEQVRRGYIQGVDISDPSVVSINGAVASLALNELAVYLSGARLVSHLTWIDLLGSGQPIPAQWTTPLRIEKRPGCFTCTLRDCGDEANIERYALEGDDGKLAAAGVRAASRHV